jgi:GNAT superfamily N-acetyltransferase
MDRPTSRPLTVRDVDRMVELAAACDRAWWGQPETERDEVEQRLRLAGDLSQRTRGVVTGDGLVAYAVRFGSHDTDVVLPPDLDPAVRPQVEDVLLGWVRDVGADRIEAPRQDSALLAAYARYGFEPTSSSFELERAADRPLPETPALPGGVELRAFDRDRDGPAVHTMLYRFWTEVPTHHHRDLDEWRELFLGHASYDADHQVVAWRDGVPVGVAICRVFGGDTGWVAQLGVAPDDRGSGLGRVLLLEATHRLATTDGVEVVGLAVVARNEQALGLYRSVGFEVTREWVSCTPAATG